MQIDAQGPPEPSSGAEPGRALDGRARMPAASGTSGPRVVLTRDPAQAGDLERELVAAGVPVAFLPLTEQRLPADAQELLGEIRRLESGHYGWLVLTSANTVRALCRLGWDGRRAGASIAVTGPGTARVLRELTGLDDAWMPATPSAAGILAELPGPDAADAGDARAVDAGVGNRVLLPQSASARPQLRCGLIERGFAVRQVIAYRTVPRSRSPQADAGEPLLPAAQDRPGSSGGPQILTPADLRRGDVVLVTSSTAALELVARLGSTPECRVVAIGGPTASTLRESGHPPGAVLGAPTADEVIAASGEARLDWVSGPPPSAD